MKTLSKTQANKIINECFDAIPENIWHGFSCMREKLFKMELAAEKQHRSGRDAIKGFSVNQAAKYFTVSHLFDGMVAVKENKTIYTAKDILHIRNECIYAYAYALENTDKLESFYQFVLNSEFAALDYAELMKQSSI